MNDEVLISCKDLCKNFGPTRALKHVDFELRRGEVCGLIGENGSGKSTLTSIFAGAQSATSGEMFYNGEAYKPNDMLQAQSRGVAMIVQEAGTLNGLDVASNVFVGNLERFSRFGMLNRKKMFREADEILNKIGASEIRSHMAISSLDFENRKIVEIARAMYLNPEVLIVDETTTALATHGRELIYRLIRQMQEAGNAVIFISHDLDELIQVCNTVTVLRDGVKVARLDGDEITEQKMRELMVGREFNNNLYRTDFEKNEPGEILLEADHITNSTGYVRNLSFTLHRGEILGFGGLANCGMHEVGQMLFGLDPVVNGRVCRKRGNQDIVISSPLQAVKEKLGYISKDRDLESLILNASIQENITLPSLKRFSDSFFIMPSREKQLSDQQIKALRIKCVSGHQFCSELSGGNKQKVAFAKWIGTECDIIIMDCPTRGVDIGVKAAMYDLICELKKQGCGIIMISEELVELIGMSDRMIIMKDGKVTKELERDRSITDSMLIEYMI